MNKAGYVCVFLVTTAIHNQSLPNRQICNSFSDGLSLMQVKTWCNSKNDITRAWKQLLMQAEILPDDPLNPVTANRATDKPMYTDPKTAI